MLEVMLERWLRGLSWLPGWLGWWRTGHFLQLVRDAERFWLYANDGDDLLIEALYNPDHCC